MPKTSRSSSGRGAHLAGSGHATFLAALSGRVSPAEALRAQRAEIRDAASAMGSVVYAIKTADDLIKFGYTTNLFGRLAHYGIGIKDARRLLMVKAGTPVTEQEILLRFARHVARGKEYFHPTGEIIEFINEHRSRMGVPPLSA